MCDGQQNSLIGDCGYTMYEIVLRMEIFYLMTDQPTTCPICGVRCAIIADLYHTNLHLLITECLNINCKHVFLEVET